MKKQVQIKLGLSQHVKDMLVGKILGDGGLSIGKSHVNLQIEHSIKQYEYIFHMWDILNKESCGSLVKNDPKLRGGYDKRYKKIYYSYYFTVYKINRLENLWLNDMYSFEDKKKRLINTNFLYDLITPRALAYWIMDDGLSPQIKKGKLVSYHGVTLSTDNFTLNEVLLLKDILEKKFRFQIS